MTEDLLTDIKLYNMACATFAAGSLQSFDADHPAANAARNIYPERRDFCLGLYVFSWTKKTVQLSKLTNLAHFHGYKNAYALPPERLGPPLAVSPDKIQPDRPFNAYDIHGNVVFCDHDPLYALIRYRPLERDWPPTFVSLVVKAVAAAAAIPRAADKNLAKMFHEEAFGSPAMNFRGGLAGAAIDADKFSTPPKRLEASGGPLVDAYGGRRRW